MQLIRGTLLALLLALTGCSSKDKVPIMAAIGIPADVDQIVERTRAVARNLIYANPNADPGFFDEIVAKVGSYAGTAELERNDVIRSTRLFALDGVKYKESDLKKHVGFVAKSGGFSCIIYDGKTFVLVVLDSWY